MKKRMTESKEHYLLAIHVLSSAEGSARLSDIALRLGVTKASTCNALGILQKRGYLDRTDEHRVILTPKGEGAIDSMMEKYDVLLTLFSQVFGVDQSIAQKDAGSIVHVVSDETIRRLADYTQEMIS